MSKRGARRHSYSLAKGLIMHAVQRIVQAVSQLSLEELACFREWFNEFDTEMWDEQIRADSESGKLDKLADQAIADLHAGKCRKL